MSFFRSLPRAGILALGLTLTACDRFSLPPAKAKVEEQAAAAQKAGDYSRAVRLYESILDGTAETAKVHYSLALIYDDKLKDPVSALHHFRRYLRMSEDPVRKKEVAQFVQRLELEMAAGGAESGIMTKREAGRLKNENLRLQEQSARLQEQNARLEGELADARKRPSAKEAARARGTPKGSRDAKGFSTVAKTAEAERAVGAETRTYVVQKGDTLASIARKFYQNAQRYKDIADANQNQLNGTVDLKVGQTLIIPR